MVDEIAPAPCECPVHPCGRKRRPKRRLCSGCIDFCDSALAYAAATVLTNLDEPLARVIPIADDLHAARRIR